MKKLLKFQTVAISAAAALLLTTAAHAQVVLTDIGAAAPTPGPNDISQLVFGNAAPAGLNYYWDNGANNGAYMGQSFTTGSNPQGYTLTSLALQTAGNGGGGQLVSQSFTLNVYQLSGAGLTTATLLNTYTATSALVAEQDWMQWTGLGVSLAPNTTYAYGFGRSPGTTGNWEELSTATGDLYTGGQACSIASAGGAVTYSSTPNNSDATFDIGLMLPAAPIANPPGESPAFANIGIVAGTTNVTLTASAAGSTPIGYVWQTDGGSGGTLTNIPGAAGVNLVVDTTGWAVGTYQYDFVATNSLGTNTSPTAAIVIVPVAMLDIGPNTPTPGPIDIAQLLSGAQADDGFNYYTDNGAGHGNWCGQTFTTGTNSNGYLLQTLAWKSGGGSSSAFGNYQPYDLYFYSISADGTTATLLTSYQGNGGGADGDWFEWYGLNVALAPNGVYAYTFGRDATSSGWESIATQGGNPYPGGQLITIANANTNGGPVTYGPTGTSDAVFDLGLVVSQKPFASTPIYTPNISPIYGGTPVTLQENAVGTPPLTYQWLTDNGLGGALVPVAGGIGTSLSVNTATTGGTYNYAIIVKNSFGSSTSAPVTLNISPASAPILVTDITPVSTPAGTNQGYIGQTMTYSATFTGTLPITYQWYFNGSPILAANNPSAVSNTLVLANLQPGDAGTYNVIAHNSQGNLPSSSSGLAVLTPPAAPAAGTYGALVVSETPVAYWRLNEANDPSTGVLPTYDASGNNLDGVFGQYTENGFNGILGPQPPAFPGFEANNTALLTQIGNANSYVTVPALNLNPNGVTISMWINPIGPVAGSSGLFMSRNSLDGAGFGFGNTVNAAGVAELGYWWNTNSAATYNFNSGLYPPIGQWSYVALVVQSNQAAIYLYYIDSITGKPDLYSAVNPIPHGLETFSNTTNTIGTDPYNLASRVFNGDIDEVAVFNSAFTSDQVLAQFSKGAGLGPVAASISGQPQSVGAYAGKTLSLTATGINGTSPFTYQWQLGGVNLTDGGNISGSQTASLTISNATPANSGTYKVLVTNPVGTTPSSNAIVTVTSPVPGSYEAAVVAANPFAFWKLNETSDPSVGGVPAYDYAGVYPGTYQVAAQNGFNGIVGPEAPAFPGFPALNTALGTVANTANSYVTASAGSLIATNLTYAMWIKPSGPVENWAGLLMDRGGAGEGLGFGGSVDGTGMSEIGYTWNQNSTWSYNSNLFPPANEWSFVAMVIEPTKGTLYLINSSGVQTAVNAIAHDSETFGVAWHIGDDAAGGTGSRTFPGSISDVSVYLSSLSSSQVTALYDAGLGIVPPPVTLKIAPASAGNVTLTWTQGTLVESTNVAGPWIPTTAVSPYTVGTTNSGTFFRVQVQ